MRRAKQVSLGLLVAFLATLLFCSGTWAKEVTLGFTGPLSGPGAGYGEDVSNGIKMAVKDINEDGGVTIDGENYTFKVKTLDDQIDPTAATNNALRLSAQSGAKVITNPVFNTLAPLMEVNEQQRNKFLLMAYSSTPKIDEIDNDLTVSIPPPFTAYVRAFSDIAWKKGYRKAGMVVTLGAYGDEWRHAFTEHWESLGGEIVADKPANYYTETDFSSQLSSVLSKDPDVLLIGGPSEPTGLVIEQARDLGYEGGFILVDQAKMDYIADVVFDGDLSLMDNTIGIAPVLEVPSDAAEQFNERYEEEFGVHNTMEAMLNYGATHLVVDAMKEAGTVKDPEAIKAAMPEVLPQDPNAYPTPFVGMQDTRLYVPGTVGVVEDGEYSKAVEYIWWAHSEKALEKAKEALPDGLERRMLPIEGYGEDYAQ